MEGAESTGQETVRVRSGTWSTLAEQWPLKFPKRTHQGIKKYGSKLISNPNPGQEWMNRRKEVQDYLKGRSRAAIIREAEEDGLHSGTGAPQKRARRQGRGKDREEMDGEAKEQQSGDDVDDDDEDDPMHEALVAAPSKASLASNKSMLSGQSTSVHGWASPTKLNVAHRPAARSLTVSASSTPARPPPSGLFSAGSRMPMAPHPATTTRFATADPAQAPRSLPVDQPLLREPRMGPAAPRPASNSYARLAGKTAMPTTPARVRPRLDNHVVLEPHSETMKPQHAIMPSRPQEHGISGMQTSLDPYRVGTDAVPQKTGLIERRDIHYFDGKPKFNRDDMGPKHVLSLWFRGEEPVVHGNQMLSLVGLLATLIRKCIVEDLVLKLTLHFESLMKEHARVYPEQSTQRAALNQMFKDVTSGQDTTAYPTHEYLLDLLDDLDPSPNRIIRVHREEYQSRT